MSDYYNIIDSAEKRAREEGREEGVKAVAKNMLNGGLPIEQIAELTGLSIDDIHELSVN